MRYLFLSALTCFFTVLAIAQNERTVNNSTATPDKKLQVNDKNFVNTSNKSGEDKDALQMNMTDKAKLEALEKQLFALNKQVQDLQAKLTITESKLAATENKFTATENKLATVENKYAVFQVQASQGNLWNLLNNKTPDALLGVDAVRIDNAACDGNPNARIFITQQMFKHPGWGFEGGGPLYPMYNTKDNKWYIKMYNSVVDGYSDGGHTPKERWATFVAGDLFNVLVTK